ncbi:hypothetical protein HHK36_006187 [Tetracentron sinense]|uniref:Photosystem I reaction center subunit VI n=1 Tax=Tetracentron sinense TaxID=13715 RepID=A0A834ZRD7_TETSI|nr:hypothetical protein HHK36_006187 [Tetracentron sinense]
MKGVVEVMKEKLTGLLHLRSKRIPGEAPLFLFSLYGFSCGAEAMATIAVVQPVVVKGLGGSSLIETKLSVKPSRWNATHNNVRCGAVVAKYGENSIYFDLEDLGNTTGQWDLYGSDVPSPYNSLQSKFFETFAGPFTKRGLLLKFLILGGGSTLAYLSSTASVDILPIKKGPQLPPKLGPRGKI